MEVVLLENVRNLGPFGKTVKVSKGYGRNYLVPQGKALPATKENLAKFEARRMELEALAQSRLDTAQQRAAAFDGLVLTIAARAAEEGKLYGSVGVHEVLDAVKAAGHEILRQEIRLPAGPIHALGEYEVVFSFHTEVEKTVPVIVVSDKETEN